MKIKCFEDINASKFERKLTSFFKKHIDNVIHWLYNKVVTNNKRKG